MRALGFFSGVGFLGFGVKGFRVLGFKGTGLRVSGFAIRVLYKRSLSNKSRAMLMGLPEHVSRDANTFGEASYMLECLAYALALNTSTLET